MLEMLFNRNGTETWRVRRSAVGEAWGTPEPVSELDPATTPELSRDGLTVYIGSERTGGFGANDIWISTRANRDAAWRTPVHVPELSGPMTDTNATPSDDGLTVVMARRVGAPTGADVHIATRANVNAAWNPPVELTELTSSAADGDAMLTSDGLEVYFYSTSARAAATCMSRGARGWRSRSGSPSRSTSSTATSSIRIRGSRPTAGTSIYESTR